MFQRCPAVPSYRENQIPADSAPPKADFLSLYYATKKTRIAFHSPKAIKHDGM
jgi:hypothetical protein